MRACITEQDWEKYCKENRIKFNVSNSSTLDYKIYQWNRQGDFDPGEVFKKYPKGYYIEVENSQEVEGLDFNFTWELGEFTITVSNSGKVYCHIDLGVHGKVVAVHIGDRKKLARECRNNRMGKIPVIVDSDSGVASVQVKAPNFITTLMDRAVIKVNAETADYWYGRYVYLAEFLGMSDCEFNAYSSGMVCRKRR